MKTLELFNSVIKDDIKGEYKILPEYGVVVEPSASSQIGVIEQYLKKAKLNGEELNKTFHKSWNTIVSSTRGELFLHQILHYMTTYGTGHQSKFIYMPNEESEVPQVEVEFLVIRGLSKEEIIEKCFGLLNSGVALKEETINDLLFVLDECDYIFTGAEPVKNKEALIHICNKTGVVPQDPTEFLRYMVYLATESTLLIKNRNTYKKIENCSNALAEKALLKADEKSLAQIFNRFKPIFLAFKKVFSSEGKQKINRISKLSKTYHKPIAYNILSDISQCTIEALKKEEKNLKNANFFQIARCLNFLEKAENATRHVYNVRSGTSYVKEESKTIKDGKLKKEFLLKILKQKFDLRGTSVYIPDDVVYALPSSEKNFVGNIPMGTKFISNREIAYGVYWENSGGARDIDLSALSASGKVGWNSSYCSEVMYSGDVTNAPNGAVEYISTTKDMESPHLVMCNIYSGKDKGTKMRVVLGNSANIDKKHMMNPNEVWFTASTESLEGNSIVGLVYKNGSQYNAVVMNRGAGSSPVSGSSDTSRNFRIGLVEQYTNMLDLKTVLKKCGAEILTDAKEADIDLTPSKLERDSILGLFV